MISLSVNGEARDWKWTGHALALGAARHARPDRHQVQLRHRGVRLLHGTRGRRTGARLCHAAVGGRHTSVTTIEGLSKDSSHPVQRAWMALDVPQCGYCQSGQIMTAVALLARIRNRPMPISIRPCPACCAAAAPIRASVVPSSRR